VSQEPVRLTQYALSGGCGAKLALGELDDVLSTLACRGGAQVIVGLDTRDDAGVVRYKGNVGLVHTIDVITPLVDEPEAYGRVAAANAVSDIWAMGGVPTSAVSLLAVPEALPRSVLSPMMRAAEKLLDEAGAPLIGGHTVKDAELKLGFAVAGTVDLRKMLTNTKARPGDRLILTKRLGTGILYQALKKGLRTAAETKAVIRSMTTLNREARDVAVGAGVRAGTDVTASAWSATPATSPGAARWTWSWRPGPCPPLMGVAKYLEQGVFPGTIQANLRGYGKDLVVEEGVTEAQVRLAADPQTSGGLLLCVPRAKAAQVQKALGAWEVGGVEKASGRTGRVRLR
jgi:selenide,water dikinase